MKKILNLISYVMTICLFCALYIFLFDLVYVGKISKFNHIWANVCQFDIDGTHLNCMINNDITCIVLLLLILAFILFRLTRIYHKRVLLMPIFGFLLFVLSIITCWGLV